MKRYEVSKGRLSIIVLVIVLVFAISFVVASSPGLADHHTWLIQTVDSQGYVGWGSSLAFDHSGNPAISYNDGTNRDLKYAHWNGSSWDIETVDSKGNVGHNPSLAFDNSGNPAISYHDYGNRFLKYAHWNGSSWDMETVDWGWPGTGWHSSLAFDSSGNPAISYFGGTNGALKYAHFTGTSWTLTTVDSHSNVGWFNSLAFDGLGNSAISYCHRLRPAPASEADVKYAHFNGTTWDIEVLDGGTLGQTSLVFDSEGNPAISYGGRDGALKYAHWNGASWGLETVDDTAGRDSSLAFDNLGNPAISYGDDTNGLLKYAHWNGSSWDIETVDSGNVQYCTSLAFNPSGNPGISYYDGTNRDLKYAYLALIQATIDINPDTLNLNSKGKWIGCYIELQEGSDVANIDVTTILLNGTVSAELKPTEVADYDNDGIPDLMVKFDRASVQQILEVGDEVELTVTGELGDGTSFEGTDVIRIIDEGDKW